MKFIRSELVNPETGELYSLNLLMLLYETIKVLDEGRVIKIALELPYYNLKKPESKVNFIESCHNQYNKALEEVINKPDDVDIKYVNVPFDLEIEADVDLEILETLRTYKGNKFLDLQALIIHTLKGSVVLGDYLRGAYINQEGSLVLSLEL